jgi:hypothetical protein
MKMKSLAILAMAGCLASVTYIAPALADDANSTQTMQAPVDNIGSVNTNQGTDAMSNGASQADTNSSSNGNGTNASSSDDASPDTATGDDDY